MTSKEFVLSIYPHAKFIRYNIGQTSISIGTEKEPYLSLGWVHNTTGNEDSTWENAEKIIYELMVERFES